MYFLPMWSHYVKLYKHIFVFTQDERSFCASSANIKPSHCIIKCNGTWNTIFLYKISDYLEVWFVLFIFIYISEDNIHSNASQIVLWFGLPSRREICFYFFYFLFFNCLMVYFFFSFSLVVFLISSIIPFIITIN